MNTTRPGLASRPVVRHHPAVNPRELLPWRAFSIDTSWPPEVTAVELRKRVGERRLFGSADTPFTGSLEGHRFQIARTIRYRNSFLPVIEGTIEPAEHGARIRVRMRLNWFVAVFIAFWIAGTLVASVAVVASAPAQAGAWVVVLMPIVGIAMCSGGFAFEAYRARIILEALFPRPPRPPRPPVSVGPYR
jgi:hypothetical protein